MAIELSLLIARIIAISFISIGLGAMFKKNYFQKVLNDTFKNASVTLLVGLFTVVVSFLIVAYHNVWESSWVVIITIFGWLGLAKGIVFLISPKIMESFAKPIFKGGLSKIFPYVVVIVGLVFAYFGFVM
jgi:hypothetical protein